MKKYLKTAIATALLTFAYSSPALATSYECPLALFEYGDNFPIEKLGEKIDVEKYQEPQPHGGHAGEMMDLTEYSSGENRIITSDCDSCNPKVYRTFTSLMVSEPLPCGLKKGQTEAEIIAILGKPDNQYNKNDLYYSIDEANMVFVSVTLEGGKFKLLENIYSGH